MFGKLTSTVCYLSFSLTQLLLYQRRQNQQNAVLLHPGDFYLRILCQHFNILAWSHYLTTLNEFCFVTIATVPLFENQPGAYQACENLADMWGIKSSCSPENQSQLDSASLPVTPAVDPSPNLTPTSSPSLFAGIHKNNSAALFNDNQFDTALLSATQFHSAEPARVFVVTDTPKICNAPKKRLPENSLMDLIDYLENKT